MQNVIPILRQRIQRLEWESEIAEKALDEAYAKLEEIRQSVRSTEIDAVKIFCVDRIVG